LAAGSAGLKHKNVTARTKNKSIVIMLVLCK